MDDPLDQKLRHYYGVQEQVSVKPMLLCRAISPTNRSVQREALITFPSANTAAVHIVAYETPSR